MELGGSPVQNIAASCDTVVHQSDELLKTGHSDYFSIGSSTVSIYGSDSNLLSSCSSSARTSSYDIAQMVDENDNIDTLDGYEHWGETTDPMLRADSSHLGTPQEREETGDGHVEHGYSKGDYSKDPDLLSWYCLGTC